MALAASGSDAQTVCTKLQGARPQAQLEYLQGERPTLTDACMIYAMDRLARAKYAPSIDVPIGLLDYRVPDKAKAGDPEVQSPIPFQDCGEEMPPGIGVHTEEPLPISLADRI